MRQDVVLVADDLPAIWIREMLGVTAPIRSRVDEINRTHHSQPAHPQPPDSIAMQRAMATLNRR
jgi:hypothetical protein